MNRWFDKHSLIRIPNGKVGINFEHSFSDGMVWNRMLSDVLRNDNDNDNPLKEFGDSSSSTPTPTPTPKYSVVEFDTSSSSVQEAILKSNDALQGDCVNCVTEVSERSERVLRKTRIRATTKLKLFSIFDSLASPPAPLKMRLASLGAGVRLFSFRKGRNQDVGRFSGRCCANELPNGVLQHPQ